MNIREGAIYEENKKIMAPILITLFLIIYAIYNLVVSLNLYRESNPIIKIVLFIVVVGFIILCVSMLIERIHEVKGGEEDDLGKY